MKEFQERIVIVTGGASGIGRAVAERLVAAKATVVLADINKAKVTETASQLGEGATAAHLDVCDAEAVKGLIDSVVEQHGRLDYLFNNAGIAIIGEVIDMNLEDWTRVLDVNLRGVVNGVVAAYPIMVRQGWGHIVNTASVSGLTPFPGIVPYSASKHAVVGLSIGLRMEAFEYGIKVSCVCPGIIDTELVDTFESRNLDRNAAVEGLPIKPQPVEECAKAIIHGVRKNYAVIVVTRHAKLIHNLNRFFPSVGRWLGRRSATQSRKFKLKKTRRWG